MIKLLLQKKQKSTFVSQERIIFANWRAFIIATLYNGIEYI